MITARTQLHRPDTTATRRTASSQLQPGSSASGDDWSFLPPECERLRERYAAPADFWADMTPPADPDGYNLPESLILDGVDPEIAVRVNDLLSTGKTEMLELAYAAGLSAGQAQRLYQELGPSLVKSMSPDVEQSKSAHIEQVVATIWPQDTTRHLDIARRGARSLGLNAELEQAGLSCNPSVLKLAHAVGLTVGEDALIGLDPTTDGTLNPKDAYTELLKLVSSDAYKRQDPHAVRRVAALATRASRRE